MQTNPRQSALTWVTLIAVCALIVSVVHFAMHLSAGSAHMRQMEFFAVLGAGMTQEECRAAHGEPEEVYGPGETISPRMFPIREPRTDQGTVWLYTQGYTLGVLIFFDQEGRCTGIRIIHT